MKRSGIALLLALGATAWAMRSRARDPATSEDRTAPNRRQRCSGQSAHRTGAAALAFIAIASAAIAGLIYPTWDLPVVFILAAGWFLGPLAVADHKGDMPRIKDLLDARREPVTINILKLIARTLRAMAALVVSVVALPVAFAVYLLLDWKANGGSLASSGKYLPGTYITWLAMGWVVLIPVAWVVPSFALGYCEARAAGDPRPPAVPGLRRAATIIAWGARRTVVLLYGIWPRPHATWDWPLRPVAGRCPAGCGTSR
jgi:hypothetical protein